MIAFRIIATAFLLMAANAAAYFLLMGAPAEWGTFWAVTAGMPAGMLFTFMLAAGIEAKVLGFKRSSFYRLFVDPTPSARTDLFYLLFGMSGLKPVAATVLSFGLTLAAVRWSEGHLGSRVLTDAPWLLQFLAFGFLKSFGFYAVHALMHSRWFWEIHRVHHSATELTVLTPHRNHPVDAVVVILVNAIPAAVLGVSPSAVALYMFLNGFYQSLIHSQMTWGLPWVDRFIVLSPEAHRIHHSNDPRHWHKNLGTIPLWDHVFGTFLHPRGEKVEEIGFTEARLHNTGKPWAEVWPVFASWLGGLWPRRPANRAQDEVLSNPQAG